MDGLLPSSKEYGLVKQTPYLVKTFILVLQLINLSINVKETLKFLFFSFNFS